MTLNKKPIIRGYNPYQLLRVYTYYRVLLSCLLLLIYEGELVPNVLGRDNKTLFLITCCTYIAVNLISMVFLWLSHNAPSLSLRFFAVFSDICAITLLMYASGGTTSGLGYLLIVAVAAAGMLIPAQLAVLAAAIATIGLIGESVIHHMTSGIDTKALFSAGSLGAMIFITALSFQYVTRKIRHSTEQLQAQTAHVAHLQKLARLIVKRMRTGIVVLNQHDDIELINDAAQQLLGLTDPAPKLAQLPYIKQQLQLWRAQKNNEKHAPFLAQSEENTGDLRISFANLELEKDEDTLVFIEDNRALAQQAQQLKLASLGRLTASIAHEIRNPLGAISHASQLLGESANIHSCDQRMLEIISNHTQRVNHIIENILQVSRRKSTKPSIVELTDWLESFASEYAPSLASKDKSNPIAISYSQKPIYIKFDPSQLHQIISNLVDNAMRYTDTDHTPAITIAAGIESERQNPYLSVTDKGPGISPQSQRHIFEPFFTTESTGSGLGLFISKELCEANQAFINYMCDEEQPSCFVIQFAHPDKVQL